MVSKIAVSLLSGFICGFVLNAFYLSLKHVWPENYFGLSGSVDPVVSRNLPRWAVFRLIPPAVAAAAAAITAERAEAYVWVAAAVTIALHARHLIRAAVQSARQQRRAAAVQETAVAVVIVLIMTGATLGRAIFAPIIPEPPELVSNIWAGFLAAVGAVYLQKVVLLRREPVDLLTSSFDEIPMTLKVHAWARARTAGIDPIVPLAVMAAENLQRPPWVRRLERCIPRALGGTRGIMQQTGADDDRHSIDLAFERNFLPAASEDSPWPVFTAYNPVPEFWDLAWAAHTMLSDDPSILRRIEDAAPETGST